MDQEPIWNRTAKSAERLAAIGALVQQQNQNVVRVQQAVDRRRRERRRRDRVVWVRQWILRRPKHGLYDKLMVELRNEDTRAFKHFMMMPPAMFDEVVQRLTPRLAKQNTNYRASLEPGLKVAITLRHLAPGYTYSNMQYAWRVPHNTISLVVREVVKALIEEYTDELLFCPTTEQGWRDLADQWYQRWNFPHTVGAIDGKHVACKAPPKSGSEFYNYKGFYSVILFAMVDAGYKFTYIDVSGNGSSSDAQIYNESDLHRGLDHFLRQTPCPMTIRMCLTPSLGMTPPHCGPTSWSRTAPETSPMKIASSTIGCPGQDGSWRTPSASWPIGSKFCSPPCNITMKLSEPSWKIAASSTTWCAPATQCSEPTCWPWTTRWSLQPGAWREGRNLEDTVVVQGPNTASRNGKRQRNLLKHWCNSPAGSVYWQEIMVAINWTLCRTLRDTCELYICYILCFVYCAMSGWFA